MRTGGRGWAVSGGARPSAKVNEKRATLEQDYDGEKVQVRNGDERLKGCMNGEARFQEQKRGMERRCWKDRSMPRWRKLTRDEKGGNS